jgi:predicted AAA+ superfamily ATPase
MSYIPRILEHVLKTKAKGFPVLILTGPRRSGKTTLLRHGFPGASYHLLEDSDLIGRVESDPRSFIEGLKLPAILDEIQNVPKLLNYIRTRADLSGTRKTQWLLTGSQEPALMKGVTESMAGRAAIFHLLPLSHAESPKVSVFNGGFPEIITKQKDAETWYRSYTQTYLERDIRGISSIRDLSTFRRFLALVASRTGQVLNKTDIASPLGISIPTVTEWMNILEATHQIILAPPFFENFGKRLIKSPKIYFTDSGFAAHLLGFESEKALARSTFAGPLFESFIAAEIVKTQLNAGKRKELYYFRDRPGLEVDFVVPAGNQRLVLLEAKASRTVRPENALSMIRLMKSMKRYQTDAYVVHLPSRNLTGVTALREGVKAVPYAKIPDILLKRQL